MAANVCTTSLDHQRRGDSGRHPGNAFAGVATLVLALLASGAARAQAGNPVSMGGAAQPLTIGVQERTTYDSNVARGNQTAAELRNLSASDVIYAPSLTVNYVSPNPRRGIALRGYFGYDYYQRNESLRHEKIDFSAAGNATFGRCVLGGQASFDRGQSSLEDLTILVTKNTIQTYTVSASETCATTGATCATIALT